MQSVKLNLIPGSVMPVVNVSQYDKARQFALVIYEGASQYSLTGKDVQIRGTKPDGNGFAYDSTDGVVSVSGSTVTISTTQQMTAVGGQTMAELRITQSGVILGTLNFVLMVEPSALSDDTPISDTDIPAIERDFEAALAEAEADALKAEGYAVGTQEGVPAQSGEPYYQDNAKYYKEQAEAAASGGGADALKAEGYAVGTQNGVPVTSGSPYYHNNAAYYEGEASTSATNAATSETNAGLSETAAGNSATNAAADALVSEGWAVGKQNGTPVTSGSPYYQNNAEYYKDQAAQYAAGGLNFKGSVAFASIPTTGMVNGDEYNITDDFTTDNRFIEGSGISVKAGTNIAWIGGSTNKWDLLATGGGGASTLDDLSDVTLTTPASGQVLEYDGLKWANANLPSVPSDLDDLSDVTLSSPTSGQFLKYDGSKWVNGSGGGGASDLDDLTDVDITSPTDGQVLKYDSATQKWVNGNGGGGGGGFVLADWLTAGGLNPMSYADLAAVLADEEAVRRLMTIHLAVDYLAGQTAVDASINTILTDNVCAKWINLRDYALDTLDKEYRSLMESLGKYYYGEWALMPQVPTMTSNTAPYGEAFDNGHYSNRYAYCAFDSNKTNTWWEGTITSGQNIIGYKFINSVIVKRFSITTGSNSLYAVKDFKLQGSNDGTTYNDIQTYENDTTANNTNYFDVTSSNSYTYYRLYIISNGGSQDNDVVITDLQFYAWQPKGNVPIMTSNTAPYGTVNSITAQVGSANIWHAFDGDENTNSVTTGADSGVGYMFTNPVCVKRVYVRAMESRLGNVCLEATNDGTNWVSVSPYITTPNDGKPFWFDVDNDTYYMGYRVHTTQGSPNSSFYTIQFYGREMKVSVPVMTSNTAPYGTASATTEHSTDYAYKAFDGDNSTVWESANYQITNQYVRYKFDHAVCIKKIVIQSKASNAQKQPKNYKIQSSNDGTTFGDLTDTLNGFDGSNVDTVAVHDFDNNDSYDYYQMFISTNWGHTANIDVSTLQFFGFDYSEYDWDTVNPRHYLYDHGVELETLQAVNTTNGWTWDAQNTYSFGSNSAKLPYGLKIGPADSSVYDGFGLTNSIDLSSYNLYRIIADPTSSISAANNSSFYNAVSSSKTLFGTMIADFWLAIGANNGSLDVSNVNQSAFITAGPLNSTARYGYVYEMWLE